MDHIIEICLHNVKHAHFVMPPPLGAGGIMFSGCPSVRPSLRPKPEIPSFDLYMGPLVHPTNRNRFTACPSVRSSVFPSVRQERFSGICRITHGGNGLKLLHADVSWPLTEMISLWPWSVDFGTILTLWNGSNLGFPGISWRTHGENGLKFCTLMYLDHCQNWLVLGYGLLIFAILALFWLSETGQIWGFWAFPGERMKEMAWNFARWCILTTFRISQFWVTVCLLL